MLYRYTWRPVAQGIRTDHPVPELPFVDDAHIPIEDRAGIESVGRHVAPDMWGRQDKIRPDGGWAAFTTDPTRHDLAWCVRWHPQHGRTVLLYADNDVASAYMAHWGPALLFRAGGYWWDGETWYRPLQVWDRAGETYLRRPVPAATTVTVADLRAVGGDPDRSRILPVGDVHPDQPLDGRWADHLALWTTRHVAAGGRPLDRCVVSLNAPELAADQLVPLPELARIAGVAASTLRAYQAREQNDVPLPQAAIAGRNLWARPVAEEYAEAREQGPEAIAATMTTRHGEADVSRGIAELWRRFAEMFMYQLWQKPGLRRRWALRWRTETAVRQVAEELGWDVAANLNRIVPMHNLGSTLRYAILHDIGDQRANLDTLAQRGDQDAAADHSYGLTPAIANTLAWYIRHDPTSAHAILGETIGDAERQMDIPRHDLAESLRTAVSLDRDRRDAGHDDSDEAQAFGDFFARLLPQQEP